MSDNSDIYFMHLSLGQYFSYLIVPRVPQFNDNICKTCQNIAHSDGSEASMIVNAKDTKDLTSPCKPTLGTILEEDEEDSEVEVENTLHETELVSTGVNKKLFVW